MDRIYGSYQELEKSEFYKELKAASDSNSARDDKLPTLVNEIDQLMRIIPT